MPLRQVPDLLQPPVPNLTTSHRIAHSGALGSNHSIAHIHSVAQRHEHSRKQLARERIHHDRESSGVEEVYKRTLKHIADPISHCKLLTNFFFF